MSRKSIIFHSVLFILGLVPIFLIVNDVIIAPAGRVPLGLIGLYMIAGGLKPLGDWVGKKLGFFKK